MDSILIQLFANATAVLLKNLIYRIADAIKSTWLIDKGETYFLLIFLAIFLIMDFAEWFKKLSK